MTTLRLHAIAVSIFLITPPILASFDTFHFYRAHNFLGEPRLAKNGLSSLEIFAHAGATEQSRNSNGDLTCLLNIYGKHNMHLLGEGVPNQDKTDPIDIALTNLALVPGRDCFGQLLFKGKFSIQEVDLLFTQNICSGWFFQLHIPARNLEIQNVCFSDCSPTDDMCPNVNTPEWQTFLNLFTQIMDNYGLTVGPIHHKGIGDTTVLAGWTHNYQETEVLDYIDTTIKIGVIIPTSKVKNENVVFDLPLGNNGHLGVPIQSAISLGSYDWLTVGGSVGAIIFNTKAKELRMKTHQDQNGFIKLAQGKACIKKGNIWYLSTFVKADHFCRGLSVLVGYSFVHENPDFITPQDTTTFNETIVNSDAMFKEWQMHTIHLGAEYDFTQEGMRVGPHVGLFYNRQVGGKRTFNTSTGGGTIGIDVAWDF